ncbi:uncharacterized protein CC84DRAFT_1098639 [Paraphaeosphaeria sporulosa]|uniref:Uncharacterized protein n=1 Tax=Paraphaeosphaeria sporulosa TaxID=1460663 RepID=A0A177C4B3_9PLEO|nr:uncharacterized protein CC84DRAFT_1098639 [Paraphaeosphaeria sporulosa]OAG02001.1 hypothetical protein CC84DRAFT_1098639 [Paraphaeosphaeria sporulosa]
MVQIRTRCWPGTTRLESTRIARPYIELFPLSADHLITLMQHNVYRGFLTNMLLLNLPNIFGCDVNVGHCGLICPLPLPTTLPPTLAPTPLQQRVPHEPWMDLFPLPALRDKLIKAEEPFDSCELCFDILGALVEKNIPWKGILIWGDPWLLSSWELSEGFWKRWGWLMRGCGDDVMLSTNRWRATRGEQALTLEQTI